MLFFKISKLVFFSRYLEHTDNTYIHKVSFSDIGNRIANNDRSRPLVFKKTDIRFLQQKLFYFKMTIMYIAFLDRNVKKKVDLDLDSD